ncbi:MAG: hypothetical protein ACREJ6_12295 [Candidatus Methylomirabilis sp.]
MAENARPSADVAYINWGDHQGVPVDLWDELNEEAPDPSSFIQTIIAAPVNEHYVARLSALDDPGSDDGHVLRIQARKQTVGGERLDLTAELRQGYLDEALQGDLIEGLFIAGLGETSEVFELAIPPEDAAIITDYDDLYVRVVANQPHISYRNSALRSSAGLGCGAGDLEALSFAFGASVATKLFEGGDTWNREETERTIKAGMWQALLFYSSTSGSGPTNKIRVQVRVLNLDCSVKQVVMDQTASVAKGQTGTLLSISQSAGAVALAAGDILAVTISKVAGNQAVTLRYNGTPTQAAMSKIVDPGEDLVNSKAEVSWIELEVP